MRVVSIRLLRPFKSVSSPPLPSPLLDSYCIYTVRCCYHRILCLHSVIAVKPYFFVYISCCDFTTRSLRTIDRFAQLLGSYDRIKLTYFTFLTPFSDKLVQYFVNISMLHSWGRQLNGFLESVFVYGYYFLIKPQDLWRTLSIRCDERNTRYKTYYFFMKLVSWGDLQTW